MSKTFLYQINVTRDCNLRCTHCYISSMVKKLSGRMEAENFVKVARGIAEHMSSIEHEHAEIHVIGGEPTMLGPEFFEDVVPQARAALDAAGVRYELSMVSNLLHPQIERFAPLFDRIHTSWEPVSRFPKPKLEQRWREAVAKLREAGVEVSVTTAMTKPVVDLGATAILEQLHGREGFNQIHFGFFIPSGDGKANLDDMFPEFHETSAFLIEATEWYAARRDEFPDLWVNPCESMMRAIDLNEPVEDIVCPIIAGSMDIDFNGNAATCLEEGGDTDAKWSGNVVETSVAEVANAPGFRRDVVKAARPHRACHDCDAYDFCRSGCGVLARHWDPENDKDCPGFKGFIDHVRVRHGEGLRPRRSSGMGGRC